MNWDNVEIYNCEKLEMIAGLGESGFVRIPKRVRDKMNERARFIGMDSVGCEVRFVTDAPNVDLYLSCIGAEGAQRGEVRVFRGNFLCNTLQFKTGETAKFRLNIPESFGVSKPEVINDGGFSSNVIRLVFNRGCTFVVKDIDTLGHDIRPPREEEKPALNWLAYGSSITNSTLNGYPHVAARKLRVQVQNKGLSGACHLEKEVVDFMVDECSWDFATCELGINVRGITPEEFEKRAAYLIDRFADTGKPVVIIGVFPNCRTRGYVSVEEEVTVHEAAFEEILERLVTQKNLPNLHFYNGSAILDDFTGLSGDLLHPCDYGHALMGVNLAEILRKLGVA